MARKVEVDQKEGMVLKRIHGDSKVSTISFKFSVKFGDDPISRSYFSIGLV